MGEQGFVDIEGHNKKRSIKKFGAAFVGAVVLLGGGVLLGRMSMHEKADKEASVLTMEVVEQTVAVEELMSEIKNISELAMISYEYTDAGKFETKKQFEGSFLDGIDIPLSGKSFIARWEGCIKIGIDLEKVGCFVDETHKTITVTMPPAKILSHEIDNKSFETLDETKNIFNQIEVDDVNNFLAASKEHMEKKVEEKGMLSKSVEKAEALITNSLNSVPLVKEDYKIIFEEASENE